MPKFQLFPLFWCFIFFVVGLSKLLNKNFLIMSVRLYNKLQRENKIHFSEWEQYEKGVHQKRAYTKKENTKKVIYLITINKNEQNEYEVFMSDTLERWRVGLIQGLERAKAYGDRYLAEHLNPDLHN